jgi:hypothetical protein
VRSKIKAHHVAIVAVCTIAAFVLSFELGRRFHPAASAVRSPFHGFINRHVDLQIRGNEWLLGFVSIKSFFDAGGSNLHVAENRGRERLGRHANVGGDAQRLGSGFERRRLRA